jgi:hypothetical protein
MIDFDNIELGPIKIEEENNLQKTHNKYYFILKSGEKIVIIFKELSKLNIEADKATGLKFNNNKFYIGSTEYLQLRSLGEYQEDLPIISFIRPTQAIIDYEYEI